MVKYRVYFEPVDVNADDPEEARRKVKYTIAEVSKIKIVTKEDSFYQFA